MAYGADNPVLNQDHFIKKKRPDTLFGRNVLELTSVTHLNLYAIAENIPKSFQQIDVALYHVIHENFDLGDDCKIVFSVAPQSAGVGLRED